MPTRWFAALLVILASCGPVGTPVRETAGETTEAAPHNFRLRVQKAIEAIQSQHGELLVVERMSDVARRDGAKL